MCLYDDAIVMDGVFFLKGVLMQKNETIRDAFEVLGGAVHVDALHYLKEGEPPEVWRFNDFQACFG